MSEPCPGAAQHPLPGCQFKGEATEPHKCPYAVEINDDHELCTCCVRCTQECSDEI